MEPPPAAASPQAADGTALALRALLAAIAVGLVAFGVLVLQQNRFTLAPSNVAGLGTRLALAAALLWVALKPAHAARVLRAPGLTTAAGLGAFALVAAALYVVFGIGTIVETATLLQKVAAGEDHEQLVSELDRTTLLLNLALNFLIFTIPALAWASGAQGLRGRRALDWLRLRRERARWSVAWALTGIVVVFWLLIAAGLLTKALGGAEPSNPRAEAIARSLDIPSALLVALLTGIGEEVFFRGFLQRKIGVVPQALLFGLAHANYLQVLEVTVTAFIGYVFGRTAEKTGSIVGPIVGHATFNFVSLVIVILKSNGTLP